MNRKEYLLSCLGEECAETAQEVGKCLRFTLHHNFLENGPTNLERLAGEMMDIYAILSLLKQEDPSIDIPIPDKLPPDLALRFLDKRDRTIHYMNISREMGTLSDGNN